MTDDAVSLAAFGPGYRRPLAFVPITTVSWSPGWPPMASTVKPHSLQHRPLAAAVARRAAHGRNDERLPPTAFSSRMRVFTMRAGWRCPGATVIATLIPLRTREDPFSAQKARSSFRSATVGLSKRCALAPWGHRNRVQRSSIALIAARPASGFQATADSRGEAARVKPCAIFPAGTRGSPGFHLDSAGGGEMDRRST
jgi:hypothetical protein